MGLAAAAPRYRQAVPSNGRCRPDPRDKDIDVPVVHGPKKAGVSAYGPSNLQTLARSVPPDWATTTATVIGDPDKDAEDLQEVTRYVRGPDYRAAAGNPGGEGPAGAVGRIGSDRGPGAGERAEVEYLGVRG